MADGDREFALLCPHCGEENPPEFPVCWNCHGHLPPRAAIPLKTETHEPSRDPEAVRRRRKRIAVELAVAIAVVWAPWFIAGLWYLGHPMSDLSVSHVLRGFADAVAILALLFYFGWLDGDWRRRFGLSRPRLGKEALWTAIAWLSMQLAYTLAILIAMRLGLPGEGGSRPGFAGMAVWLAPLDFLVWALVEELFYRAYLWDRLTELTGRPVASIVISALLFSAGHVYPPIGTLSTFFIGVILGWIFATRRSLWSLVLGHCLINVSIYFG
jgi:membrane protease YdiL (CAAX protease family)